MAWQARIAGVKPARDRDEWIVDVEYYNDVAPSEILFRVAFEFARAMTVPQMRAQIVAKGQALRTVYDDTASRAQSFVGTVVAVT